MIYINPDAFLGEPRVWTPERSRVAWERCYAVLSSAVAGRAVERLYIVFGVQGGGKTCWIKSASKHLIGDTAAVFDAALPAARHRSRAIEIANSKNIPVSAVWIDVPLGVALSRNQMRSADQRVPQEAIESVFSLLEAPSFSEGFSEMFRVDQSGVIAPYSVE